MYGFELAEIYELVHQARGKDYRAEAREVAARVRARRPDAASLLDVACGTGGHLRHFAEMFDHVEGLELAEPMRVAATAALPGVTVHAGDMRSFALGRRFDVITCMFGAIGYAATDTELATVLRCFARHLLPGGIAVVDPWWFAETYRNGYVSGDTVTVDDRTVARVSHSTFDGGRCRMDVHYLVADSRQGVRHFSETHLLSLFTRTRYERAFAAADLAVEYIPHLQAGRGLFIGVAAAGRSESTGEPSTVRADGTGQVVKGALGV